MQQEVQQSALPRLPALSVLFKAAWNTFTSRFGAFVGITFALILIFLVAEAVVLGVSMGPVVMKLIPVFMAPEGPDLMVLKEMAESGYVALVVTGLLLSFVVYWVFLSWYGGAFAYAVMAPKGSAGVGTSLKESWKRVPSLLWISFLSTLILGASFFVFVVPYVYLSIAFGLAIFVLFAERAKGFGALMRSKDLVKGYWWAIFGRAFLLGLPLGLLSSVLQSIGDTTDSAAVGIVIGILLLAFHLFLLPGLISSFSGELYKEVVAIKGVHAPVVTSQRKGKFAALTAAGIILAGLWSFGIYQFVKNVVVPGLMEAQFEFDAADLEGMEGWEEYDFEGIEADLESL